MGLLYLPPGLRRGRLYSPDFNPIEQVLSTTLETGFAKINALLRRAAPRSLDAIVAALKTILHRFPPD
ncbi:hypothetical protein [Sphingomonas sp.]|jgi:transposase|uniref:hypothetical protein n=1 Tax=Sphingomonas sp. TaxID=28214 RepID=UPI0039C8F0EA